MTNHAYICDAIRTPFGRYGGALAPVRADDLGAIPLKALMQRNPDVDWRSEEHTSELQSLMRISYAVFCLKKKKQQQNQSKTTCITHVTNALRRKSTQNT